MRETIKSIRDAEAMLMKRITKSKDKAKSATFDPKKPKSVRIYVATEFPAWQNQCVQAIKDAYSEATKSVDDVRVRELLGKSGLLKDKRTMPFVQTFKKRIAQFGAETAFRRTLPFSEVAILSEILPYLKKTLGLDDAEVFSIEDAKTRVGQPGFTLTIIESAEPGSPACEYRNV
jgi:leucyl-tRNA synthetase